MTAEEMGSGESSKEDNDGLNANKETREGVDGSYTESGMGTDIDVSFCEEEGEGEPTPEEEATIYDREVALLHDVDAIASDAFDGLMAEAVAAPDAFLDAVGNPLPETSQDALRVLRQDAANALSEARDVPAQALTAYLEGDTGIEPVDDWVRGVREDPFSVETIPTVGLGKEVLEEAFPNLLEDDDQ